MQREFPCPIPKPAIQLQPLRPGISAVAACVNDNAIITTDVVSIRCGQTYPLDRQRQWLTSGRLGTMGFGLPAAIGAALANPIAKCCVSPATAA
ncbi:thiamine pyrophosphate-dependent enzyme [Shigella flexneri]